SLKTSIKTITNLSDTNCLEIHGASLGYQSITFPAISTGAYGYPRAAAAEIAVKTVLKFITRRTLPDQIYFVCFDEENARLYKRLLTQQGDERTD
ncbi:macro domain-containing protein, partial [Citrobacter freundii]|uniref:macro domain-containing protein n=1 Tax=Citrobacter freundii TaxID=546 RepID=UPI0024E158D6